MVNEVLAAMLKYANWHYISKLLQERRHDLKVIIIRGHKQVDFSPFDFRKDFRKDQRE